MLSIAHVDLYFFFDIDVTLLNVEVFADDLSLDVVQEILHRFGRAYPAGWDAQGQGMPLDVRASNGSAATARVLAESDSRDREKFLTFVGQHRVPRIASHWAYLLYPLVQDQTDDARRHPLPADRVLPHAGDGATSAWTTSARCRATISSAWVW